MVLQWHTDNASHNRSMVIECLFACVEESRNQMFGMRGEQGA